MEFKHWPKIPRIENEAWAITEKIDGTNGVIAIDEDNHIYVGSRNRWLDLHDDNHGFYKWTMENEEDLLKLGPGYHYGEWYGQGIQRGYGLKEKRFALFYLSKTAIKPDCCEIVSTINVFDHDKGMRGLRTAIWLSLDLLQTAGSVHVPGYTKPEGIIIRSFLTGQRYKYILE